MVGASLSSTSCIVYAQCFDDERINENQATTWIGVFVWRFREGGAEMFWRRARLGVVRSGSRGDLGRG